MSRVGSQPSTQPGTQQPMRGAAQAQPAAKPAGQPGVQVPHEKIAMRAYEKWCQRGRPSSGTDQQDWLEAETELRAEMSRQPGATGQQTRR